MKKIILLLLISGGLAAQVVVPRSTTTFSNVRAVGSMTVGSKLRVGSTVAPSATLDVTGTMSVSGASTLTGIVNTSSLASTSSLYFNAAVGNEVFFQTNGTNRGRINASYSSFVTPMRIGSVSAPNTAATLDVSGTMSVSSTMTLGTAGLTGGNTGTVAVLSDAVFGQNFICMYSVNPTDATTYYFSNMLNPSWLTSTSGNSVVMPYNATLVGYSLNYIVNGTLGSAESGTLQIIASGSATDLNTALSYTSSINSYTATNLSVSVAAGNLISAVIKTPTWVTDPTNLRMGITFWFVRRQ